MCVCVCVANVSVLVCVGLSGPATSPPFLQSVLCLIFRERLAPVFIFDTMIPLKAVSRPRLKWIGNWSVGLFCVCILLAKDQLIMCVRIRQS